MTPSQIATKYVGIPYKHHGRDVSGLDCWGLLILIYADLGHKLIDITDIGETDYIQGWAKAGKRYLIENYHRQWGKIDRPIPLCAVAFRNDDSEMVHVGVMLDDDRFIHCRIKGGVVISHISEAVWSKKLVGFYLLKAMA